MSLLNSYVGSIPTTYSSEVLASFEQKQMSLKCKVINPPFHGVKYVIDENYDWGDVHTIRKKIWEDQPRKPRIDVAAPLLLLAQNVFLEKKNRRVFAQWTFHPQFDQH